jgi:Uncharacterised protein family (UPF0149)
MFLSEFDGFCAGVIVCPEMIPPSEWLPHVFGGNGPLEFEGEETHQKTLDLIMEHYNSVARSLMPPETEYGPVFEHDTNTDEKHRSREFVNTRSRKPLKSYAAKIVQESEFPQCFQHFRDRSPARHYPPEIQRFYADAPYSDFLSVASGNGSRNRRLGLLFSTGIHISCDYSESNF